MWMDFALFFFATRRGDEETMKKQERYRWIPQREERKEEGEGGWRRMVQRQRLDGV